MGDHTYWTETCKICKGNVSCHDAPSSLIWSRACEDCGWNDGLDYYQSEDEPHVIELLTEQLAREKGLI